MTEKFDYNFKVDARDLRCPMPLLKTKLKLNKMQTGDTVLVLATDVGSEKDIPAFCNQTGYPVKVQLLDNKIFQFLITKK